MGNLNSKGTSKIQTVVADPISQGFDLNKEARVDSFIFKGVGKTKDDLLVPIARELFLSNTYGEVIARAEHVAKKLEDLECFERVNVTVDSNKKGNATQNGLEVAFDVKELPWMNIGFSARESKDEMQLLCGVGLPNMYGGAEKLKFALSANIYGSIKELLFSKPILERDSFLFGSGSIEKSHWECSGYSFTSHNFRTGVSFKTFPKMRHNIMYECSLREQNCLVDTPSSELRDACGDSKKSSLHHTLEFDCRRPGPGFPVSGHYFTTSQEFAGIGGDIGYFKTIARISKSIPLLNNVALELTGNLGGMYRLADKKVANHDKFYLGGMTTLRGFEERGIGPHDSCDLATGGDLFYTSGLHLYYRIPSTLFERRFGDNMRMHTFMNAGSLIACKPEEDISDNIQRLFTTTRLAFGLGFSIKLGEQVQVELNYCVPYSSFENDRSKPGVQWGIGINFT